MEASHGSTCSGFSYTHTSLYQIPPSSHPHRRSDAVLHYYSRIWIYLRRAPIKVQTGRSMRPIKKPLLHFWGLLSKYCCLFLALFLPEKQNNIIDRKMQHSSAFVWSSATSVLVALQGLGILEVQPGNELDHQNVGFIQEGPLFQKR